MAGVTIQGAFPQGAKGLRGGGKGAWRVWVDVYPSVEQLAKLVTIAEAEVPLNISFEVAE